MSLKTLFSFLIHPILEYGAFFWNPHTSDNTRQIEMVQRKFLSFAGHILHIRYPSHYYILISDVFNMETLARRLDEDICLL